MGVSIEYRIGGDEVGREQFFRDFEEQVGQVALERLRASVQRIRCPQHGRSATLEQLRITAAGVELGLSGCCDDLVDCVLRELD
jgi:hypothetical protein